MGHVFISYARSDRILVDRVRKELNKGRQKGWLDVDGIAAGGDWRREIDDALKKAAAVVLILSPASTKSQYVTYEWSFALGAGIPVIPVLVKETKLHPRLEALQYIDFSKGRRQWGRLIDSLQHPTQQSRKRAGKAKAPEIYAEFELEDGQPMEVEESYRLWIGTKRVPDGTKRVTYEILDESYPEDERRFSVGSGRKDFMDWITSHGNIFLTARGKGSHGEWRTQSTLAEALRRRYGPQAPRAVRQALTDIDNN